MVRTVDAVPARQGVSVKSGQGGSSWLERRGSFLEAVASDPPMFMSPLGWDGLAFFPSGLWAAGPVFAPLWSPMDSGSPSTILLISFSLSPSITLGPASKSWPGSHATRDASPPWAIVLLSSAPAPTPLKAPHG